MGAPDFFIGLRGGGSTKEVLESLHKSIPSFRHSGRSDKNQCRMGCNDISQYDISRCKNVTICIVEWWRYFYDMTTV